MGNTTVTTDTTDADDNSDGTDADDDNPDGTDNTGADSGADDDADDDEDAEAAIIATLTPAQAAIFTRQQEALTRANANARSKRLALKALRSGQPPSTGPKPSAPKVPAKTGEGAPAFDWAAERAALLAELKTEQNTTRVQTAAERALKDAGLVLPEGEAGERKLARVMRMVDWTGVDPAEVGDEVDDLKTDHPELFKAVKRRPRTGGVAGPGTIKPHAKGGRESELFD